MYDKKKLLEALFSSCFHGLMLHCFDGCDLGSNTLLSSRLLLPARIYVLPRVGNMWACLNLPAIIDSLKEVCKGSPRENMQPNFPRACSFIKSSSSCVSKLRLSKVGVDTPKVSSGKFMFVGDVGVQNLQQGVQLLCAQEMSVERALVLHYDILFCRAQNQVRAQANIKGVTLNI